MSEGAPVRVMVLIKGLGVGGAERLLERAIPYLDRRRYAYQVAYLLPWKNALVPAFQQAGIPVHCLSMRRAADWGVLSRLAGLLRRERVDLVHAHLPVPGVLARLLRRRSGARWLVYTEHNVPSRYRLPTRLLNAATYRANDAVIAVSQEVATRVQRYVRGGRPRVVTIPNAIDADELAGQAGSREAICREFGFPPDARVVVHVANLVPKKGHRYLLAAARRVIDREPRARFLLVGLGPLAESLAAEARRLGLNGQVVFTGFRPDAVALMGAADLVVLPSVHEGLPLTLLEAMALGRPVVASRVGGVPEVVRSGETGVLVEPMDVDALASQILTLLGDATLRERLGEGARQQVRRRYGMAQMVAAVEDVYRQVRDR